MALKGFLLPSSQNIGSALVKASTRKVAMKKSSDQKSSPTGALTKSFKKSDIISPQKKNGALIKSFIKSDIISPQKKNSALVKDKNKDSEIEEQIKRVEIKVIKLQELFKNRSTYDKIKSKKEKRNKKNEEKIKREKDLENNKKPNKFNIGKFSSLMPKTGILDAITNFLLYTVLGYLNNRFDIIPKLIGLIPMLMKTMDFVINIGGFLLEGLVTFIDFGYGLVDKTRGFIKALGGDGAAKAFDKFLSTLNILFNLALVAALVNAKGGFGGKKGKGGKPRGKPGTGGRPKVTTSGGKGAGRPDIRNPLRNKPPVTTSGGGKQGRPNVRNPLRGKPPVTGSGGGGGLKLPNIFKGLPKVSPGAFAKGAGTLGIGIALDMGVNALESSLDQSRQEKIINKIKTFPPEKRKKIIAKMQEDLKKEKDYQVSPLHAIDKVIKMGGETMSEKKSNDFRTIIEGLGETPKHALGGLIGKANAGLSMMGGMMSLPPVPKLSLPNLTPQSIGNSITGGFKSLFALFGLGGDKKDEPPTYLKGLIKLGNKVKDVPLIGGAMYAAIQLAMGSKVDRRVLGFVGGQLTNFSNLDAFKGISSSASKLSSALQFASGGQIPSTVVSLSPSDNRKSIISLSNYLDREIQSIELELDKEKEEQKDLKQGLDDGGGGGGGDGSGGGASYGSPEMKALLDVLAHAEGTTTNRGGATGPAGYSTWAGYQTHGPTDLTNLTIQQVHDLQTSFMNSGKVNVTGSAVVGRYQFKDLKDHYAKQAGLKPSDLFSPENQDKMAIKEMERVNVNTSILKEEGLTERSFDKLAPIWASLPYSPKGGKSYYGQSYKNPNELISVYKKQLGIKQADLAKTQMQPQSPIGSTDKNVQPISHPDTGSGYTIAGLKDQQGRPAVFSRGGANAFSRMMSDSKGEVKGSDIASSQRSPQKNAAVGGVPNSNHLYGNALDIHGSSQTWMRRNGKKYGWNVNDYDGSHGGHFDFKGGSMTMPTPPVKTQGNPPTEGANNKSGDKGSTSVIQDRSWNTGIKLKSLTTKKGIGYKVASVIANQFKGFVSDLEATGYKIKSIGGYRKAGTGGGTGPADPDYDKNRYSHPYGGSIDINPDENPYGSTLKTDMPKNISEISQKHGLGWGGNWRSVKDAMHFSALKNEQGTKDFDFFKNVAQGGGYIGKNPKVYGGINESASYEQSGMMIMIQPMIIEKSSPSMSGGGNMDKITFAGSGSVNSVNPAAERG